MNETHHTRVACTLTALLNVVGCQSGPMSQVMGKLAPGPEQETMRAHCLEPLQDILNRERERGPISRDNLDSYEYSQLALRHHIPACAQVPTEDGSTERNKQEQALLKMFEVFKTQHLIIDEQGDGGSFCVTDQKLFAPEVPLSPFHRFCSSSVMDQVEARIESSWPIVEINDVWRDLSDKTQLVEFQNQVAEQRGAWKAAARQKSDACLATKVAEIKPYTDKAPKTAREEWDKSVRASFAAAMSTPILKTVYPYANFKHVVEERGELNHDNTLRVTRVDYFVMDVYVYVDAGDFVDAYVVSISKTKYRARAIRS
ncbi:MAG: hypothetical protein ACO3JL_07830 [Myxococcota bacterium]